VEGYTVQRIYDETVRPTTSTPRATPATPPLAEPQRQLLPAEIGPGAGLHGTAINRTFLTP